MDLKIEKDYYTTEDYYNLPDDRRTELVDGQFYDMATPSREHQKTSMELGTIINNYIKSRGGECEVYAAPFSVQLTEEEDTVFEPDLSVICNKDKLTDRGCLGAPDWIIEIVSPGNGGHDYIRKLRKYMAAGVREYWIVDPSIKAVTVYNPETDGKYRTSYYEFDDRIKAGIYDDLEIDFNEITG